MGRRLAAVLICLAMLPRTGAGYAQEASVPAPAAVEPAPVADSPDASAQPTAGEGHASPTVVPAKTPIEVELLQNLNSLYDRPGTVVRFRVVDDVEIAGRVVIAGGTAVQGRIKFAEPSATNGRAGVLQVVIPFMRSVDGERLPLWGELVASGRNRSTTSAVAQIALGFWGFAVHGLEAAHLIGDRFTVRTRGEAVVGPPVATTAVPEPPEPAWASETTASPLAITYVVRKGSVRDTLEIDIPRREGLEGLQAGSIALVRLDGTRLEELILPDEVEEGRKGWTASFAAWPVVRRLKGSPEGSTHEAALRLDLPGGRAALVRVPLTLRLE